MKPACQEGSTELGLGPRMGFKEDALRQTRIVGRSWDEGRREL